VETIAELAAAYRAHRLSPVEVTRRCLERIDRLDPALHAFLAITADLAYEQARSAEAELHRGFDRGSLHGVPIALKDLIDVAGLATTGASAVLADRVATEDAEVVRRLRDAGAVILGKLNLHELAYGASGVIGHAPATRNPHSPAHVCGGSSSGSAAAVAAEMCFAAIGTDTSGSIRIPAALCGVVGLKPSYGLVSTRGVFPLSSSYDHVGPLARTVGDAALVLEAIAGLGREREDRGIRGIRIGVPRAHFFEQLDAEVDAATQRALAMLGELGAVLQDVSVPLDEDRTVFRAEAFAVHQHWVHTTPERYQPETLRRILTGANISTADYLERHQQLQRLRRNTAAQFAGIDLLATPTVPIPAPTFADLDAHPETLRSRELFLMRNTRPFSIWGTPALSIPCGTTSAGLPIGLQLAGPIGADADVLRAGAAFEAHQLALHIGLGARGD